MEKIDIGKAERRVLMKLLADAGSGSHVRLSKKERDCINTLYRRLLLAEVTG